MALAGVSEAAKDYHAKKAAAEQGGILYFRLRDGEEATVRFLEDGADFTSYYVHKLPQQGNRFPEVPCLDQSPRPTGRIACPGCEEGIKRSYRFAVNLIHRNAPVPERDKDGKAVKNANNQIIWATNPDGTAVTEDQVKVWNGGIEVAEDLDHLAGKFGGLTARDYEVLRSGVRLDTKYRILPGGDTTPLSEDDRKLAAKKFDLNQLKRPPEYDGFYSHGNNFGSRPQQPDAPTAAQAAVEESPFKRRQRAA